MKRTTFIGTAGVTAVAAYVPSLVLAQGQGASDADLRVARATVTGLIAQLQTEKADYGGHRVAAIKDFNAALDEINAALESRGAEQPGQVRSDAVLRHVEDRTQALLASLRDDKGDYAGHRVKAISDLQAGIDAAQRGARHRTSSAPATRRRD